MSRARLTIEIHELRRNRLDDLADYFEERLSSPPVALRGLVLEAVGVNAAFTHASINEYDFHGAEHAVEILRGNLHAKLGALLRLAKEDEWGRLELSRHRGFVVVHQVYSTAVLTSWVYDPSPLLPGRHAGLRGSPRTSWARIPFLSDD